MCKGKKLTVLLLIISMTFLCTMLPAQAANLFDMFAVDGEITDGESSVTVALSAPDSIGILAIQGAWSTTEDEGTGYLTLTEIGSDEMTFTGMNGVNPDDGYMIWTDDTWAAPAMFEANERIVYATYSVASNTPVGEYTVSFVPEYMLDSEYNESYDSYTFTITVTASTPTCNHVDTDKTYENIANGFHKVTCACGEVVSDSEACSGGTATCTAKAVCSACKAEYGEFARHDYGELVDAQEEVHTKDELKAAVAAHYQCSACDKYFDANYGETTLDALTGDAPVHVHARYDDITDTTHQSYCSCGAKINNPEPHDYNNSTVEHTCVCGKVEEFTLYVNVLATEKTVELTVPYGANILEVLAQAEFNAKIPALGTEIRVKNDGFNGIRIPSGYSYQGEDEHMIGVPTDLTMPGEKLEVNQDCFDDGWYISDLDDDGVHESYEFIRYDVESYGYLTEGWHYIEENYDDVQGGAWYYFYEGTGEYENWFFRAEGLTRVPYPTGPIDGKTYGPNAEDKAYWEANPDTSMYSDAETAVFVFDEDGKFQSDKNGMIEDGNITRYAINGCIPWHVGMVKDGENYYYFGADKTADARGNSMSLGYTWVTRDTTGDFSEINEKGKHYFFELTGENEGQLVKRETGIYSNTEKVFENEQLVDKNVFYYIVDYERVYGAGVVKMTDENYETFYIYVRSNGWLAIGKYWPTVLNDFLERGEYDWGTDGRYYPNANSAE